MRQAFVSIFGVIGMIAGAWMGYRFAINWVGAVIGAFAGMVIIFFYANIAFPSLLLEERDCVMKYQTTSRDLVKGMSIFFILVSAVFVIFTPKFLCGGYLGYADPFTPLALFFVCLISFTRLTQIKKNPNYIPTQPALGEKIFLWPFGLLGLIAIFTVFLWHTEPICIGISKIGAGDYQEAIKVLDGVIQDDPHNVMAHNNRGIAKISSGDIDGAIEDFNTLIVLEPKNANAYLMRGVALQLKKKQEQAQRDFDEFLRLNPGGKNELDKTIKGIEKSLELKH